MILDDTLNLYGYSEQERKGSDGVVKTPSDTPDYTNVQGKFFKRNLPRAIERVGGAEEVRYDSGCYVPLWYDDLDEDWRVEYDGQMYEIVGIRKARDYFKVATLSVR